MGPQGKNRPLTAGGARQSLVLFLCLCRCYCPCRGQRADYPTHSSTSLVFVAVVCFASLLSICLQGTEVQIVFLEQVCGGDKGHTEGTLTGKQVHFLATGLLRALTCNCTVSTESKQQCPSPTHVTSGSITESTSASHRAVHKKSIMGTGEMVWWVKGPAAKLTT